MSYGPSGPALLPQEGWQCEMSNPVARGGGDTDKRRRFEAIRGALRQAAAAGQHGGRAKIKSPSAPH